MSSNQTFIYILRFVVLVLVQVFLLNNINLNGYINPYIYLLFILLYPFNGNSTLLIIWSFFLGLSIDIFENSGGIHAAASVFAAYLRPYVLKFSFGLSYEYNVVKISKSSLPEKLTYLGTMIFLHHLMLFMMEIFSFNHLLLVLKSTVFSGIFTFILIYSSIVLFGNKSE
ncbi:MAG: rod shape-determining protein MreD [Bacteroidetes bacterium]|nr:rod shape-determining protein MreD [Bacteroidota bacterium]